MSKLSNKKIYKYFPSFWWDGTYYTKNSEWQFYIANKALNYMKFPKNAKILDVGCGDGRITKFLASSVPEGEVMGLDPSSSMLDIAKNNVRENLSFALGDARNLSFKNKFDRIVAFNSLHWVPEISIAIDQIREALVPGGQVLILVAPIQVRHQLHRIIDKVAKGEAWCHYFDEKPSVFSFYTLAEWAALIERSGLIAENLQLIDASWEYLNKEAFANSLAGWVPFGTISIDKRKGYIDDIVEAYIASNPQSANGAVQYHLDELAIIASKALND